MASSISVRIWPNNNGRRRLSGWKGFVSYGSRSVEFRAKTREEAVKKANAAKRSFKKGRPGLTTWYYTTRWTPRGLVAVINGPSWTSRVRDPYQGRAIPAEPWTD